MSRQGGLRPSKHGGAHGGTREALTVANTSGITSEFSEKVAYFEPGETVEAVGAIQDGGPDGSMERSGGGHILDDILASEAGSDSDDSESTENDDDMGTFETAVVGGNGEWVKLRSGSDGSLFGEVEAAPADGLEIGDKVTRVKDTTELFTFVSQGGVVRLAEVCNGKIVEEDSQVSPSGSGDIEIPMGFSVLETDKSNMLMTPQELETMPEGGLEFEESVGPKDDPTKFAQGRNTSFIAQPMGTNIPEDVPISINIVPSSGNSTTTTSSNVFSTSTPSNSLVLNEAAVLNNQPSTEQSDGTALISVASGKATNASQIVISVQTGDGQQMFQINTADLEQATQTLSPLALQGEVIGLNKAGKVVNSETISGITVQDGYLVIPVVPNEQGEEGNDGDSHHMEEGGESEEEHEDGEVRHPAAGGKLWYCTEEGCAKMFSKPSKLRLHIMRHTGERPFKCTFPKCVWAFTTAYKLRRHMESHQKRKDYICDFEGCTRQFTTIYNLNTHRKLHERPCKFECPMCGEKFPTTRKLDLHKKNHTGMEKEFKCPVEGCNRFFYSRHCMGSHMRVHQENRDLACKFEGCGRVFDRLCRLKQHMRSHTGERPYVCRVEGCWWAFSTASKLKRHLRKHTGERRWVCHHPGCGKGFMRPEHLKGHLVTHSGEKPFICSVEGCGARFTAKSSIYVHMKKHRDPEKKKLMYFCPLDGCDRVYTTKTTLRAHITKHYQASLAGTDLGNLIPIMNPDLDELQEKLEVLSRSNAAAAAAATADGKSAIGSVPPGNSVLVSDSTVINPTDMIAGANNGNINSQVSNAMVSQLIAVNELQQAQQSLLAVTAATPTSNMTIASAPSLPCAAVPVSCIANVATIPSFCMAAGINNEMNKLQAQGVSDNGGSARTDFQSNQMLCERAKRRRQLLREKAGAGSTLDLKALAEPPAMAIKREPDISNLNSLVTSPTSCSNTTPTLPQSGFSSPSDLPSSQGILFRDPDTGAIILQTQLLQDDPPNPEMFGEDSSSGMDADLSVNLLNGDTNDSIQFTGTTINLQDLE